MKKIFDKTVCIVIFVLSFSAFMYSEMPASAMFAESIIMAYFLFTYMFRKQIALRHRKFPNDAAIHPNGQRYIRRERYYAFMEKHHFFEVILSVWSFIYLLQAFSFRGLFSIINFFIFLMLNFFLVAVFFREAINLLGNRFKTSARLFCSKIRA